MAAISAAVSGAALSAGASAVHPSAAAGSEFEDLGLRGHARVTGGGHRQGAVCGSVLDSDVQRLTVEQAVDQA